MRTRIYAVALPIVAACAALALLLVGAPAVRGIEGSERRADAAASQDLELKVHPVHHGSLVLEYDNQVVYVDPWSQGDFTGLPEPDLILITDVHSDHFDLEMVAQLMTVNTAVVAPKAVADQWGGIDTVMANGETRVISGIPITAVPMYNIERGPGEGRLYHDPGRGNGYLIELGGQRIYVSGDTECIPEMRQLQDIDVAFVCMNLPYTMTPGEAAECVKAFKPKVVYPYHYRGSELDVFQFMLQDEPDVEVRIADWYGGSAR